MLMTHFTLQTDTIDKIFVIRSKGYLDEKGGEILFEAFQKAIPQGHQKFILNLSDSPVINSQGIAKIIEISEIIVDENNGELAFVGLSELSEDVFKMVGLLQLGDTYNTEQEAIEYLNG